MSPSDNIDLKQKVTEYGAFITKTLQPQLQQAVEAREEVERDISEYHALQASLVQIQDELKGEDGNQPIETYTDLAHGAVYCRARLSNPRTVFIDVGLRFHVEMKLDEAQAFIDKRVELLKGVLKHKVEVAQRIAKDVEDALDLLQELGDEMKQLEVQA